MSNDEDQRLIDAFLVKGGEVKKIAAGKSHFEVVSGVVLSIDEVQSRKTGEVYDGKVFIKRFDNQENKTLAIPLRLARTLKIGGKCNFFCKLNTSVANSKIISSRVYKVTPLNQTTSPSSYQRNR